MFRVSNVVLRAEYRVPLFISHCFLPLFIAYRRTIYYPAGPTFIPLSCAILFLFFTAQWSSRAQLVRGVRGFQTRPINSANPAINEIINKNPNEAKSAVIEVFLCGRCAGPLCGLCVHDLIIGNVFRIACQLAAALKFDWCRGESSISLRRRVFRGRFNERSIERVKNMSLYYK